MKTILKKYYNGIVRFIAIALLLASVAAMLPVQTYALSDNVHDILFDSEYYYQNNSDVARAFGRNETALRNHYNTYGKREGRAPSELFNPREYLSYYADLRAAFGSNYARAYDHFVSCGINESRKGSSKFDVTVYKANYADLRNAFGSNNLKYLKHYREYGKAERRNAVSRISTTSSSSSSSSSSKTSTSSSSSKTNNSDIEDGATYTIVFKGTDMGLNVQYRPGSGIGNIVFDNVSNFEDNEVWKFTYNKNYNAYYITPFYRSGAALNALYGAQAQKGSQLKLHDSNKNDTASLWYLEKSGNYYRLKNVASGYYIDSYGRTRTGASVHIWSSDQKDQLFTLTKADVKDKKQKFLSSNPTASEVVDSLPGNLSAERRAVVENACSLVGKVKYFWGGKSTAIGWDNRWGTTKVVTSEGSKTTGTKRTYGLDCSGFVTWSFVNAGFPSTAIGDGTSEQVNKGTKILLSSAEIGDLAFNSDHSHVGIVVGKDSKGNVYTVHCSSGANNVVITKGEFSYAVRPNCY